MSHTTNLIFWCIICLCSGFGVGWILAIRYVTKLVKPSARFPLLWLILLLGGLSLGLLGAIYFL